MPIVSVLVPVYNAAAVLFRCLDSLCRQTLYDIQILCVDDCSTDNSWQILSDYASRDSRIEIYKQPMNGGQAKARNAAILHASGTYVAFLDSDDWLSDDALERCVAVFEQHPATDCVLLTLMECDGQGTVRPYNKPIPRVLSGREAFEASLDWSVHGWYVTRRTFYEQWPYDDTCKFYSDDNTTRIHYYHSREVRSCDGIYYYWHDNADSATHSASVHRFDYLRANESMKQQLETLSVGDAVISRYENIRWLVLVDCYMFYHVHSSELSSVERKYGLSELQRVWKNIDRKRLDRHTTAKLGYCPCKYWWMFRLQEWLYFTLRGFVGKNR